LQPDLRAEPTAPVIPLDGYHATEFGLFEFIVTFFVSFVCI
jgi:hypothetical protein